MSPVGATYAQHLDWLEREIHTARTSLATEDRLVKFAEELVRQAEGQRNAIGKRISSMETEAARTRAALAGIEQ